jgi:hypothetical protein
MLPVYVLYAIRVYLVKTVSSFAMKTSYVILQTCFFLMLSVFIGTWHCDQQQVDEERQIKNYLRLTD